MNVKKIKKGSINTIFQTNWINDAILSDLSDIQKSIIYTLQHDIDFNDMDSDGTAYFDYKEFLKLKEMPRKNAYPPNVIRDFAEQIIDIKGYIFNRKTNNVEIFNIIDKIAVSLSDPENFTVTFATWGKIVFFRKFAEEYAGTNNIPFTRLENNIISLRGAKKKKLYELISSWRSTGMFIIDLDSLREKLGFDVYEFSDETLFQEKKIISTDLPNWKDFKKFFLELAINDINSRQDLRIKDLSYTVTKKGRKIVGLVFKFTDTNILDTLTIEQKHNVDKFIKMGLNAGQVEFLLYKVGINEMLRRINGSIYENPNKELLGSSDYGRDVYFDRKTGYEIGNLGGFFYDYVFPELH